MGYLRYVAVGDSQTEGMNDGDELAGYRGWADRLAELLAEQSPGLLYANLAVRGHLAGQVRAGQLEAALALEPDLVTVMAGMNDLVRPGFDAEAVAADLEAMFRAFTASGATVITFTFPDVARIAPLVRHLRPRLLDFNERIRAAADRYGVLVVDSFPYEVTVDARLWSPDRIHATPLGHARIAAAAACVLGLPGSDTSWTDPLAPPLPPRTRWRLVQTELAWVGTFLAPWLMRRLRGRSSGDGRVAKRPLLLPVRES
ncbi:SGNH/GDSL hydrolase family protein [Planomonospora sp. ID67723]|uniref:SGNH/GDSL hydrolase family protein n=1 Tax=Planomonospora sp. ID67723 TaxID=2738134 RepID=UPI0018C3ADE5|nr:SGNH/GDSL hydrolase family protein [Planomonospora sp. ID67723]MBG0826845.1 SGNH/GDSL hydrolase family protein [Planomonospora sp. ID67723]